MKPSRKNNFDFLRLFLAVLVVRCHAGLVGLDLPWTSEDYFLGGHSAVHCFFVISGYLIFRSWDSKPNLASFAEKRARRILPAYIIVVLACTIGLSLVSTFGVPEYFSDLTVYRYAAANLAFVGMLQNTLPGVFEDHQQSYVNGPLWTIKIEVMFYVSVPIIVYFAKKLGRTPLFIGLYLGGVIWNLSFSMLAESTGRAWLDRAGEQLPGQMAFFIAGAAMYYYRDFFDRWMKVAVIASIPIVAAYFGYSQLAFSFAYPIALAVLVIGFANHLVYLGNWGRYGDFSYGLYIFHYPILQILASLELPYPPSAVFALGCFVSLAAAIASWHWIESRWLLSSSHYVTASKQAEKTA